MANGRRVDFMIQTKTCINVYSDMNTWIDFCIVIGAYEDFTKAEEIVQKAYDDWWELPDAEFLPIAEYIGNCLEDNGIEFDMYYSNEEGD